MGASAEERDILKGFKVFQSSRNCFKYSEKQIGFSHGNLYNLHLPSNSSPAKTFYNRNKLEIYLKRNSSNLYVQNLHVVATGELLHSVFCCSDWALLAKINVNIQDCSRETTSFCHMRMIYAFYCRSETQNLPPMILDIGINKFHSEFGKTKNISQCKRGLPRRLRHWKIII